MDGGWQPNVLLERDLSRREWKQHSYVSENTVRQRSQPHAIEGRLHTPRAPLPVRWRECLLWRALCR
jgi:hypothetical protein